MKQWRKRLAARLKDKRGFTLIEMVLVTAIIGIFFTMAAFIIPTWYRAYQDTLRLNYARQIADSVLGAVEEQIRFADELEIVTGAEDNVKRITGKRDGGRFYAPMEGSGWQGDPMTSVTGSTPLIDGLVYDEDFFMDNSIRLDFELGVNPSDPKWCRVTVQVVSGDGTEVILTKERTVLLFGE
ncbi:MAG: type II secretion system protein [Roseburia sp.]